ncbi:MAG: aldose 1-epimerase, partial [Acidobacteria bacterium]|nr:aldose 1-epimerase [Acidobacteriota bacterium]
HLPGKGPVEIFSTPPIEAATKKMDGGPDDFNGNESFRVGGAILLPFANRIRGRLSAGGQTLETTILDKPVSLPANWTGKKPGAEKHSIHGLILASRMTVLDKSAASDVASVRASLDAGNFQGHWPSRTEVTITATLKAASFGFTVEAKNTGTEPLPMGIGWHPYFAIPSAQRAQAKLHLPARQRVLVNNYDEVFPTGKLEAVSGTPYDFSAPGGAALGQLFMDDCFVDLQRGAAGHAVAEIVDPAGKYGIRIRGLSPEIKAFQVYAPVDKAFVALEPQFNWGDPFSAVWGKLDTGMRVLQPGQSVRYSVELEVFVP